MAEYFTLNITTPEREFFNGDVESLVITTPKGEMGVLASHILMVVALDIAPIKFKIKKGWREAALSGGIAQIKGNHVQILTDSAEWPDEIEENRALEAKRRAEERMQSQISEVEYIRSQVALRRALTRLRVIQHKE